MQRLSKLQKRAARFILKANFDTPSSLMFQELGWLSVENRLKYNKAVITYRALNNLTPGYLSELLTPLSEIHSLNLDHRKMDCYTYHCHVRQSLITHLLAQLQNYGMLYLKRSGLLVLW